MPVFANYASFCTTDIIYSYQMLLAAMYSYNHLFIACVYRGKLHAYIGESCISTKL